MQELNDLQKMLDDSGMKLISKEIFDKAFSQKQSIINAKNRAADWLLLASMVLFLFSSGLSFSTIVYVRGILPVVNSKAKNISPTVVSPSDIKIEENTDFKVLQKEDAQILEVEPTTKNSLSKNSVKQKAESITVVEQKAESITVVEQKAESITVVEQKAELVINRYGHQEWRLNGLLHREAGPALKWKDGTKEWYLNGVRHRVGGPAVEWSNGYKSWWLNGVRHREDGPAVEWPNGDKEWWINGKFHRTE
jgi:hypothetical protein